MEPCLGIAHETLSFSFEATDEHSHQQLLWWNFSLVADLKLAGPPKKCHMSTNFGHYSFEPDYISVWDAKDSDPLILIHWSWFG